jgi:hypothetical protein
MDKVGTMETRSHKAMTGWKPIPRWVATPSESRTRLEVTPFEPILDSPRTEFIRERTTNFEVLRNFRANSEQFGQFNLQTPGAVLGMSNPME